MRGQNSVSGAIKGSVKNAQNREPIAGAVIEIENLSTGARWSVKSFTDGNYYRLNLSSGAYIVRCSYPGFQSSDYSPLFISLNQYTTINIPPFLLKRLNPSKRSLLDFDLLFPDSIPIAALFSPEDLLFPVRGPRMPPENYWDTSSFPAVSSFPGASPFPGGTSSTQVALPLPRSQPGRLTPDPKAVRLVNTESAKRGGNFPSRHLGALPLPGIRTFDSMAFLVAGVSEAPQTVSDSSGPGIGAGVGMSGQFSVNGMRSRANSFTVDGSDDNDQDVAVRRQGFLSLLSLPVEAVQEFQISTLLWDAEQGRNMGSQVNAVSRTGANRFRGQAYGFITDSFFNARNFFDSTGKSGNGKEKLRRTQAGLNLGGPLPLKHTQFFGGYEFQSIAADQEKHFSVPTAEERIFQGLSRFRVITSPNSVNNFFNYVTSTGSTPLGKNLFSLYPLPNDSTGIYGRNTYTSTLPADGRGHIASLKITRQWDTRHSIDARYTLADDHRQLPSISNALASTLESRTRSQNLSLIFDSTLSDTLWNQSRFSYGRTRLGFREQAGSPLMLAEADRQLADKVDAYLKTGEYIGTVTPISSIGRLGQLTIRPFSPVGIDTALFPQYRVNNTVQFADTLAKTWIHHTLKGGGDARLVQFNSLQDRFYRPSIEVNNGFLAVSSGDRPTDTSLQMLPGSQFAALGQVSSIFQTVSAATPDSYIGLRFAEVNFFLNDNWRIRPNLTLDFGLRYERNTVPREVNRRVENAIRLRNLPQSGSSLFDSPQSLDAFQDSVDAYRRILDGRNGIYESDNNNLGPHFGFSWDPTGHGKTALRAGYGLYYDIILGSVVGQSRNVFPSEIPFLSDATLFGQDGLSANNPGFFVNRNAEGDSLPYFLPGTNRLAGSEKDFVAMAGSLFHAVRGTGGLTFTLPEKNLRTPYVQQWHLSLEKEIFGDYLVSAAYVGSKGTRLLRLTTPNGGPNLTPRQTISFKNGEPPTVSFDNSSGQIQFSLSRKDPTLGPYQIFESSGSSIYHSLQLEARKRYAQGFTFTAAYTWSHAIDDGSDIFETAGSKVLAQNSGNLHAERADASFDVRHQLRASAIWDLPMPINTGRNSLAALLLNDWQLAAVFQSRSGQAYTLEVPLDANLDGNLTDRPLTLNGLSFSTRHGVRRMAMVAGQRIDTFFSLGQDGSIGRNTARGDGLIHLDLAINKHFSWGEGRDIEFRTEIFNVCNRANFGLPLRTLGDPGFGASTNTLLPARIIQLALKLNF